MKRILIIEDDPIVSRIYQSRLEKAGFQVEVASDGQTGYYRIFENQADAVILDLMLPKMSGIDLLKKIRAVRQFEKLPIVVFTNAYVGNMIHEAFFSGASVVYNKSSISPRQIVEVLRGMLTSRATATSKPSEAGTSTTTYSVSDFANAGKEDDEAFEADLLNSFLKSVAASVAELRGLFQEVKIAANAELRSAPLEQLCRKIRAFSTNAGMARLKMLATIGTATEALLKEMLEKPNCVTPSVLRTAAHAVEFLDELSQLGSAADLAGEPQVKVLVVDTDVVSRTEITRALEKAFLHATSPAKPEAAVMAAQKSAFDLMFLDLQGSGVDVFQLCNRLRATSGNDTAPVIFVRSAAEFQTSSQSELRIPGDLIAKPFLSIELAVKCLTVALRHRLDQLKRRTPAFARVEEPKEELFI